MDDFGQVNLESTDHNWETDTEALEKLIDLGQPFHFQYAALVSGHNITITPAKALVAYGQGPKGVPVMKADHYALVAIETWNNALAWIRLDVVKTTDWIEERFEGTFKAAPDSWALAYLLNSIVLRRLERTGGDTGAVTKYLEEIKQQLLERGEKIGAAAELK